jgi:hypothetical protein
LRADRSLSDRIPSPRRHRRDRGGEPGYLIMFAIVFDYSRWISNWAVCMFLILHAVKMLPHKACPADIAKTERPPGS